MHWYTTSSCAILMKTTSSILLQVKLTNIFSSITVVCWLLILNPPEYLQAKSNHAKESRRYSLRFDPHYEYKHGTAPRRKHKPNIFHLRSYYKYKPEWNPVKHETNPKLVYTNEKIKVPEYPVGLVQSYMRSGWQDPQTITPSPHSIKWHWPRRRRTTTKIRKIRSWKKVKGLHDEENEEDLPDHLPDLFHEFVLLNYGSKEKKYNTIPTKPTTTTSKKRDTTTTTTHTTTTTRPTTTRPTTTRPTTTRPTTKTTTKKKPTMTKPPEERGYFQFFWDWFGW